MSRRSTPPAVSIIIPCRNEERFIDRCLASVFAFDDVPGGFEVIVVDGMSNDATPSILGRWCAEQPTLRVLRNPARVVPPGLNLGIREAKGSVIVRLDAHSVYPPTYLRRCADTLQRTGADNVGGLFITHPRDRSRQARLVQAISTHRFGVGNAGYRLGAPEGPADTVPYGCFPRDLFDRIGWFDERLVRNQDYEFNRRIAASGGTIWRDPAIEVHYFNQGTIRGLLRQAVFTGQWNPWMWWVAPYSFARRHTIPGIFVLALVVAIVMAVVLPGWRLGPLGCIALPYSAAAAVASLQQSRRHGWWMVPLLPVLFLAYHLAYGTGILLGALRLFRGAAPVQRVREPWPDAGRLRAWPSVSLPVEDR